MGPFSDLNDEELARLLEEARAELVKPPVSSVERGHVAAMVEASRSTEKSDPVARPASKAHGPASQVSGLPKWRIVVEHTKTTAIKIGAGAIAACLSTMGLAYAGVDLPGQAAEKAFDVIGLRLPNQGNDGTQGKSVADDVKQVIEESDERGCEFGQAVSEVASQNRQGESKKEKDPCDRSTEDKASAADSGKGDEGKARAEEKSGGNAKANEAPRGSKATGDEHSAEGKTGAEERSNGKAKANEAPPAKSGDGGASVGVGGGKGSGDAASGKGRARSEEAKSGAASGEGAGSGSKKPGGTGKQ